MRAKNQYDYELILGQLTMPNYDSSEYIGIGYEDEQVALTRLHLLIGSLLSESNLILYEYGANIGVN